VASNKGGTEYFVSFYGICRQFSDVLEYEVSSTMGMDVMKIIRSLCFTCSSTVFLFCLADVIIT
jgi:hypothetical protein